MVLFREIQIYAMNLDLDLLLQIGDAECLSKMTLE